MTQGTLRRVLSRAKTAIGEDVADAYEALVDNARLVADDFADSFPPWEAFVSEIVQTRQGGQAPPSASAPIPAPPSFNTVEEVSVPTTAATATAAATATTAIESTPGVARVERASNLEVDSPRAASAPFVATGLLEPTAPTTTTTMEVEEEREEERAEVLVSGGGIGQEEVEGRDATPEGSLVSEIRVFA